MSSEDYKAIANEVVDNLISRGFVVVEANLLGEQMDKRQMDKQLLRKKALTPYVIVKNKLLPNVKSIKTIKDMVHDGRIGKNEHYITEAGKWYIMTAAIKRIRGDE